VPIGPILQVACPGARELGRSLEHCTLMTVWPSASSAVFRVPESDPDVAMTVNASVVLVIGRLYSPPAGTRRVVLSGGTA
jgi:hypothetical protein